RLGAGEDPAAIAKSVGSNVITYVDKPKTAISDRKVADAAFALQNGQVSGAIQGDLGMAVVKIEDVKPALVTAFEQAKPELEKQLRHDAAQKKAYEQVEAYEKAHDGGANMTEAAKAVGATIQSSGEITAQGQVKDGKPPESLTPKMLAKAYTMAQGEESETEDEGDGEYYVVRLDKVIPSALPKLEEVRTEATKAYMQRQVATALKAKADELIARIKKGESFEAVAASVGAKVEHTASLDRAQAQQAVEKVGAPVLQMVFTSGKGEIGTAAKSADSVAVIRVDDIQSGPIEQLAPLADTGRKSATNAILQDMAQSAQDYAAKVLKPKVDTIRALQALGVSSDLIEQNKKPPAKKAKG
ncbi:MAG TPA: peptidyl-prolyl cis-trans isomerase, partial [Caulobacteraceae bacterium]|nr:peptidyl-prolyl cis-trans isomerase [Caulobacteraceae bacterium]